MQGFLWKAMSARMNPLTRRLRLAKQYLKEHPEMELYDCYTDLGRTGTSFKREGFERMMQDVRKKRINCVVVKDLSRFGRNHIEAGNYIQKIFPFMGVRFIALADGIDTSGTDSGMDEMALNLKNLMNEMYARDIAQKVKSSKRSRQEQGSYTGGIPPYGYHAEWIEGKKCLFICPETSGIVKDIYGMYLSGQICARLPGNCMDGKSTGLEYIKRQGMCTGRRGRFWNSGEPGR